MKYLIVSIALCFAISISAQSRKAGVRLGMGLPNLESIDDNIFSSDFKSIAGFDGGVFLDYGLTENFSIKFELAFARRGGERNGVQPIPGSLLDPALSLITMGQTVYAEFDNRAQFWYIELPVLAKYEWHLGERWGVYVNGGFYVDFITRPRQKTSGTSQLYYDANRTLPVQIPVNPQDPPENWILIDLPPQDFTTDSDINKNVANMDFGAMLGIGASYAIDAKNEILADIRGSYGFIPLQNDIEAYGTVHMGSLTFSLGYAYTFGNKSRKAPE